jgi:hypothetical protein
MISPYAHTIAQTHYETLRQEATQSHRAQTLLAEPTDRITKQKRFGLLARLGRTLITLGSILERRYDTARSAHYVNAQE